MNAALSMCLSLAFLFPSGSSGDSPPPVPFIVRQARFEGELKAEQASFEAVFEVEVLREDGETAVTLLAGPVAVEDFECSDRDVRMKREGAAVMAVFRDEGVYTVRLRFAAAVDSTDGLWSRTSFRVVRAVVGEVEAVTEGEDSTIEYGSGVRLETGRGDGETRLQAFVGPAETVDLRWQTRTRETEVPAVVLGHAHHLAELALNVLKLRVRLVYEIPQGETDRLEAVLPSDLTVLRVEGATLRDWTIDAGEAQQTFRASLLKPVSGRYVLTLHAEKPLPELPATIELPEVRASGVRRQTGSMAVHGEEVLIEPVETEGMSRINADAFVELGGWKAATAQAAGLAFRYSRPGAMCRVRVSAIATELDADTTATVTVGERRTTMEAVLSLDIRRAGIFELDVALPDGFRVVDVTGERIEDWTSRDVDDAIRLHVKFDRKLAGRHVLTLALEQTYESVPATLELTGPVVSGAEKQQGSVRVESQPGIEVREDEAVGLRPVAARSAGGGDASDVLGFAFRAPDWRLRLQNAIVEPFVTAEVFSLATIGDGFLAGSASVEYAIEKAGIQTLRLNLPEEWQNVEVTGRDIRRRSHEGREWEVLLQDRILGKYTLLVTYDQPVDPGSDTIRPFGLQTRDTVRESGRAVVTSAAHLEVSEAEGTRAVRRIDARELPPQQLSVIENPILRAYSYAGHPYSLDLKIRRHRELEALDAVSERTRFVTVVTKPGRRETQATYLVKNNTRDVLRVHLPQEAELWTCFVAGRAVKPERDGEAVIVPLPRGDDRDRALPVELLYVEQGRPISRFFRTPLTAAAPAADVHSSFVEWEFYVPAWAKLSARPGSMQPDADAGYSVRHELVRAGRALDRFLVRHRAGLIAVAVVFVLVWAVVHGFRTGRARGAVVLLMIAAVTLVLVGMLVPALSSARERALRTVSMSNLSQLGKALTMYAMDHGGDLPDSWDDLMGSYVGSETLLQDKVSGQRFLYLGSGLNQQRIAADTPIAMSSGPSGGNVLYADGSVSWLSNETLQRELKEQGSAMPQSAAVPEDEPAAVLMEPATPAATGGEGALAAGLLPIRIELPKQGRLWRFSKVLAVGDEPLRVSAMLSSETRRRVTGVLITILLFASGLLMARRAHGTKAARHAASSAALLFLAAWVLFLSRELLFYLIVTLPFLVALVMLIGLLRRPAHAGDGAPRQQPPDLPPGAGGGDVTGASSATAPVVGLALLVLAASAATAVAEQQPAAAPPVLDAQVVRAEYGGTVSADVAVFEVSFVVRAAVPLDADGGEVGEFAAAELTLVGPRQAVRDYRLSGRGGKLLVNERGWHLHLARPGTVRVDATFVGDVREEAGRREVSFLLPPTVSSRVACVIDEAEATVDAGDAVSVETEFRDGETLVRVLPGNSKEFRLGWIPRVKRAEDLAASARCETRTLASVEDGAVRLLTALRYNVTQGELSRLAVRLPPPLRLLRVGGEKVFGWAMEKDGGEERLVIDLKGPVDVDDTVWIESEVIVPRLPEAVALPVPRSLDAQRETGWIAVTAADEVGFEVARAEGLQQADPREFAWPVAPAFETAATESAGRAFRYRDSEFDLELDVAQRTPEIDVVLNEQVVIGEKAIAVQALLAYSIRQAGVFELAVDVPGGYEVRDVNGPGVSEWTAREEAGLRVLNVAFREKVRGDCRIAVTLERRLDRFEARVSAPVLRPRGVAEARGYVGIGTEFGLLLTDHAGTNLVELPADEFPDAADGIVLAFKFTEPEWALDVNLELAEPWIRASGTHVLTLSEGLIRARSVFEYTIENAPTDSFFVELPDGARNVALAGANIRERSVASNLCSVVLQERASKTYRLTVTYDQGFPSAAEQVAVRTARTLGTEREQGRLLVGSVSTLHLREQARSDAVLLPIDPRDLPQQVRRLAGKRVRMAYRYLRPDAELDLRIERYRPAEVLQANIEQAQVTTVCAEDGSLMTQLVLSMRNNAKQNLRLRLPDGGEVWSCFVGGEAVRAALREGDILIPLVQTGENEPAFEVEVTYVSSQERLGRGRRLRMEAPDLDLPMHSIRWDLYLPGGYGFGDFGGTMTRREDVGAVFREFDLGDYESVVKSRVREKKRKAEVLVSAAREMARKGDVVSARRQYRRAKQIDKSNVRIEEEIQDLEKAEAYANVAADVGQQKFGVAFQQRLQQADDDLAAPQQEQQVAATQPVDELVKVAEEQARKIRETQEVSVRKVTPLRVNVPVRGIRFAFEQVLWVPGDPAVSVEMDADRSAELGLFRTLLTAITGFLGLLFFVQGWTQRRRVLILVGTVLLGLAFAWLVYV